MIAVFQFDSVSVPLMERLLAEGRLPTLAGLRARGRMLELETPATHFPAGSYATLYSGLEIADHGMYYSFQWSPAEQRVRWRGSFPSPQLVWERLAASGKRALVVDPYESARPGLLNGIALSGWQFVNVMSLERWSAPTSAHADLARRFGRPARMEEVFGRPTIGRLLSLHRLLLEATDRVTKAALHFLPGRFDLVWVNFLAAHLGGHMLWDLSQVEADKLDNRTRMTLERGLADLYIQIDEGIGRILAALPGDADLIVTSPMGMAENASRVDLLPGMLEAVLSRNGATRARPAESRTERFLWQLRASIPAGARAKVAAALHGPLTREVTMRLSSFGVDWSKTPAFLLPSDHFGQVRLNIRGRERDGIVEPGDADALSDEICGGLLTFRDPDGQPAVISVDRSQDLIGEGRPLRSLPDLIVRWSDRPSARVSHVDSSRYGEVRRTGSGSGRSGGHRPDAWAVVVPGPSADAASGPGRVVDIASTVCSVLGVQSEALAGTPLLRPRS
ncbi:MAG: alkaline phosphatase family protein [Gaiellaceae bacterium]